MAAETFLRNHASSIWAADLFTVQTLTFRTLYVFVVIDHGRRRIRHWNVTEHDRSRPENLEADDRGDRLWSAARVPVSPRPRP